MAIVAGGQYRQTGSDVLAPGGDVLIDAQDIAMTEARDTRRQTQETRFRQCAGQWQPGSGEHWHQCDGAAQAATGQDAETVVTGLDREVLSGDGANGLDKTWDGEQLKGQVQAEAQIVAAFGSQAHQTVETYTQKARETLYERLETASEQERAEIQTRLDEVLLEERVLNVLIGAVTGMGGSAVTKEALSATANEMRKLMIEDSLDLIDENVFLWAGIVFVDFWVDFLR